MNFFKNVYNHFFGAQPENDEISNSSSSEHEFIQEEAADAIPDHEPKVTSETTRNLKRRKIKKPTYTYINDDDDTEPIHRHRAKKNSGTSAAQNPINERINTPFQFIDSSTHRATGTAGTSTKSRNVADPDGSKINDGKEKIDNDGDGEATKPADESVEAAAPAPAEPSKLRNVADPEVDDIDDDVDGNGKVGAEDINAFDLGKNVLSPEDMNKLMWDTNRSYVLQNEDGSLKIWYFGRKNNPFEVTFSEKGEPIIKDSTNKECDISIFFPDIDYAEQFGVLSGAKVLEPYGTHGTQVTVSTDKAKISATNQSIDKLTYAINGALGMNPDQVQEIKVSQNKIGERMFAKYDETLPISPDEITSLDGIQNNPGINIGTNQILKDLGTQSQNSKLNVIKHAQAEYQQSLIASRQEFDNHCRELGIEGYPNVKNAVWTAAWNSLQVQGLRAIQYKFIEFIRGEGNKFFLRLPEQELFKAFRCARNLASKFANGITTYSDEI